MEINIDNFLGYSPLNKLSPITPIDIDFEGEGIKGLIEHIKISDLINPLYYCGCDLVQGDHCDNAIPIEFPYCNKSIIKSSSVTGSPTIECGECASIPLFTSMPTKPLTVTSGPVIYNLDVLTRGYLYTVVDCLGRESTPSPVSTITLNENSKVIVSGLTLPEAKYKAVGINIYRTITGILEDGDSDPLLTDYYKVGYVTADNIAGGFVDNTEDINVGDILNYKEIISPPKAKFPLQLSTEHLAMVWKNEVYISEVNMFHHFPLEYIYRLDANVTLLAEVPTGLLIGTTKSLFILPTIFEVGKCTPPLRLEGAPPPIIGNNRNFTLVDGGIIYPSLVGLIFTNGSEWRNITKNIFPVAEWRKLDITRVILAYYHGKLIVSDQRIAFIIILGGNYQDGNSKITTLSSIPISFLRSPTNELLFATKDGTYHWEGGSYRMAWSYKFIFNFNSIVKVRAILAQLIGEIKLTINDMSDQLIIDRPCWLPCTLLTSKYTLTLKGSKNSILYTIKLARNIRELIR